MEYNNKLGGLDINKIYNMDCLKGFEEYKKGKTVVFLIPSRTDTKLWHEFILPYAHEIRFIKGRLCFNDDGKPAPFPSCVVIFK